MMRVVNRLGPGLRAAEKYLILALLLGVYCSEIGSVPFHVDESLRIGSSYVFEEYFHGHLNSPVWDEDFLDADGLSFPIVVTSTIGRYFIGVGRTIGGYTVDELNGLWNFRISYKQNVAEGRVPGPGLLWWSRIPNALAAAAGIFLVYLILHENFGKLTAYAWVLLAGASPYLLVTLRRAMDEGVLIFGIFLVIFCAVRVLATVRSPRWTQRRLVTWLILLGVSIGFTAGAKFNGTAAGVVGLGVSVLAALEQAPRVRERIVWSLRNLLTVAIPAYLAFVLPNPFLLKHPVTGIVKMYQRRIFIMPIQYRLMPDSIRVHGMRERLHLIFERVFSDFGLFPGATYVNLALVLLGLAVCLWSTWHWMKRSGGQAAAPVILLTGFFMSLFILLMHLDAERYYVIPVVFALLLAAIGMGAIGKAASHPLDADEPSPADRQPTASGPPESDSRTTSSPA